MKYFFAVTFTALALCAHCQTKSSLETRALAQQFSQAKTVTALPKSFAERYPIMHLNGVDCIGVLAKVDQTFRPSSIEAMGGRVNSQIADIVSMRIPLTALTQLENCPGLVQYSVAHTVQPLMDKTRVDTRTDSVQQGLGLPRSFNGEGVIIGITDWGFDYRHPNINSNAERRVLRAWDMFKLSGPAPEGFDYGTEYVGYDALYAAEGDTSGLYGYHSHGTHVAGISGGRGTKPAGNSQSKYIGQAPAAQFLFGSWYLNEAAWLDQVAWMVRVAREEGKRLVINNSWGMYNFSTLDGTSLLSQAINHYCDSGIVIVTSAGNNGDTRFHLQHTFTPNDTVKTVADWYTSGIGQNIICWGEEGKPFSVGFYLVKNTGGDTVYGPFCSTSENETFREGYVVTAAGDSVRYDFMSESANLFDGRAHLMLNVDKRNGYRLVVQATSQVNTTVHFWNLTNLENNAGNMGADFINGNIYGCQLGDYYYGIGEPACAAKAIGVAAHTADTWKTDSVYNCGNIAYFSSWGPAFGGGAKPEVSAPGVNVVSSVSSRDESQTSAVAAISADGHSYKYATMSGTSMSGPAVTGVVALMLQANPNLTVTQIRDILMQTARNDIRTGDLQANDSVSVRWGHGKVDALRAVSEAYDLLDIQRPAAETPALAVMPNPAHGWFRVVTCSNRPERVTVLGVDGRVMTVQEVSTEATISTQGWQAGAYIVRSEGANGVRMAKVIVQ